MSTRVSAIEVDDVAIVPHGPCLTISMSGRQHERMPAEPSVLHEKAIEWSGRRSVDHNFATSSMGTQLRLLSVRLVANQNVDGVGSSSIQMCLVTKEKDGMVHRLGIFLRKQGWTGPLKSAGPLVPLLSNCGMDC
jgi:hypothetical protein